MEIDLQPVMEAFESISSGRTDIPLKELGVRLNAAVHRAFAMEIRTNPLVVLVDAGEVDKLFAIGNTLSFSYIKFVEQSQVRAGPYSMDRWRTPINSERFVSKFRVLLRTGLYDLAVHIQTTAEHRLTLMEPPRAYLQFDGPHLGVTLWAEMMVFRDWPPPDRPQLVSEQDFRRKVNERRAAIRKRAALTTDHDDPEDSDV